MVWLESFALATMLVTSIASSSASIAIDEHPRGTYVRVPAVPSEASPASTKAAGEPHILFLNRCSGGVTITSGWPDDNVANRSGILYGPVTFPAYPYGDASWNEVVEHTRQIFSPFNITVTDVDPAPAAHDEAIVCGSGGMAGFGGAGGVAPFTCGVIDAPITFTFPESLGNYPRVIAEVIAQEAAHAWGLEHELKCEDPMTYLSGCGNKTFQDGNYPCGEYSPRACECGGPDQNSFRIIEDLFGPAIPDAQHPSAAITHPHHGDSFAPGESFDIAVAVADDVAVKRVSLYLDGALSSEDASEPFGPWPVVQIPEGSYEIYIVATDAAGKTTTSETVVFEVGSAGGDPGSNDPDNDDALDSDASDDGPDGGDGIDDDADGGDPDFDALPPGFGLDRRDATGCACTSGPAHFGIVWMAFVFVLAGRRKRRDTGDTLRP